jgi:23S rRNA (cytidine2498-2'-O)-methyltransferase
LKHRVSDPAPIAPGESWLQLLLSAPDAGLVSVLPAPLAHVWRAGLVPFPAGRIPVASDKAAPSRAFAKLLEAEIRLGARIGPGETVVDLGACPGSWTYVAVRRGARVISVDRSPLRDDLMRDPAVTFHQGDAFSFEPAAPVDWLVCDVIAAPDRSIGLAIDWARRGWARRLVVTIKFRGTVEYPKLDRLKEELAPLCREFRLARLCANRNEACVMGEVG